MHRAPAPGATLWRRLERTGWIDAAKTASAAFVATLCVGAILLVAAKLQSPELGTGASPLSVFTAVVVVALACLGAGVRIDDVEVSALPLGALLAVAAAISWATARILEARDDEVSPTILEASLKGAQVAVPYAALAWTAALIFRFRQGATPVAVDAAQALALAALWAALSGGLGGLRAGRQLRPLAAALGGLAARRSEVLRGLQAGTAMVALSVTGATVSLCVWIVVRIAIGLPRGFDAADAIAAIVYLAAFLPNLVVGLVALALGAPVEIGARVMLDGRMVGPLQDLTIARWGGDGSPAYLWLLAAIPLAACFLAGFAARRNSERDVRPIMVIGVAALSFAIPLALAAALADARLGTGLVGQSGFAHIAPDPVATGVLASLWAAGIGAAGWLYADREDSLRAVESETERLP